MTLSEIRLRTLDWLDDPQMDLFDDADRLKRLLFDAYADVVHVLDESPVPWNIRSQFEDSSTGLNTVTWAVGVREASFFSSFSAKILEVVPLDADGREGKPYTFVPFRERNLRPGSTGIYLYPGFSTRVNAGAGHLWVMGQCDQSRTTSITARVYARAQVGALAIPFDGDNDVPSLVPFEYHPLIAVRAALLAKMQENRDLSNLAALWSEGLVSLRSFAGDVDQGSYRV